MTADEIPALSDAIYRDRVERARRQAPVDKFVESLSLYDEVIARQRAAIRWESPGSDEARIHQILLERMQRLRRAREAGLYQLAEESSG